MKSFAELTQQIERDFLLQIIELLKEGNFSTQMAQSKAKEFLTLLPFNSIDDLKQKMNTFCKKNPELDMLEVNVLRYDEETKTADLLERMQQFLKEKKVDEALALVTK